MTTLEKLAKAENKTKFGVTLTRKDGTLTKDAANAITYARFDGCKIYPKNWEGSARHLRVKDVSGYILAILERLGYKYTTGNDAPRGGINGYYIKVSKTAINSILSL